MSLVSTLGKMAVGMMVAKSVKGMMGGGSRSGGGLGGLLGSITGAGKQAGGGLGDMLGKITGGQQSSNGRGLGDLLGSLSGKASSAGSAASGGIGDLAGMLGGAGQKASGGLGGILDSLGGAKAGAAGGLGGLLNAALQGDQPAQATGEQEEQAQVMLRAMISAAKADGEIDAAEQQKISEHLDDITPDERQLLQSMIGEPNDMQSLVKNIPAGMEQQAYFMSLLAIDLDSKSETEYLQQLAKSLNISQQAVNSIHEKLGVPVLNA